MRYTSLESATGKTVHLTNGQRLRRDKVLPVPHDTVMTTQTNVIKVATKQQKDKELFKRENIKLNEADIIERRKVCKGRAWASKV